MSSTHQTGISPTQAAEWLAAGQAVLVDVREPDEFKAEHIAAAISLPLGQVGTLASKALIPEGHKVIFQCQKGGRGEQACATATASIPGHAIYNLTGGISGWKQAGLPVIGAQAAHAPSLFRQVQMIVGSLVLLAVLIGFYGHPAGFAVAGLFGAMLAFAGFTGWCGLAMLLSRMPWNRPA